METNYLVITACLIFLVYLLVKEFNRDDKSRLLLRMLVNFLMVASFALFIIPIHYSIKEENDQTALSVFTEGDSSAFPKRNKFTLDHVDDLSYYLKAHPETKKVIIYGYGLNQEQLKKLADYQVSFYPSKLPPGITSASWPKKLKLTQNLMVSGVYNNPKDEPVNLKLTGFGATLDSLTIRANATHNFTLSNTPKQIGKAVFNLVAVQGKDTLANEPIPFKVEERQPVSVLIMASFPDFEYKFLKKWLYENQYAVIFRSEISKNKYNTEFLNRKATNVRQLNQALLKTVDLVIIDEDELANNKSALYNAVRNGMGLIIRTTSAKSNNGTYEVLSAKEKPLTLKSTANIKLTDLPFPQSLFLKSGNDLQPLITDDKGKILVNTKLSGMGKVVSSVISSTFQWQLSGKQMDYTRFWSLLFEKSLRKKITSETIATKTQFPTTGEQLGLLISQSDFNTPVLTVNSTQIAPRQNMEMPFLWEGSYWAQNAGWTTFNINKNKEEIYIYHKENWKVAKNAHKLQATTNFVNQQAKKSFKSIKSYHLTERKLSVWWPFVIFLVALSYLWVEQRFLASKNN